jgi:aminoglycoside 6'-N-acetyltransferase I
MQDGRNGVMQIKTITAAMLEEWLGLRLLLWPEEADSLRANALSLLAHPAAINLIARDAGGAAIGFIEATVRRDYVNGCETSPAGFVEGLFVAEDWRGQGVARALVAAVEAWAKARGLRELASDALLDNTQSHAMHEALGFAETERVVYFRRAL